MCYIGEVDTTIRNLDEHAYRALKAHAAATGATVGDVVNAAIRAYLDRAGRPTSRVSLRDLGAEEYAEGSERLSEEIDLVVYGG